MKWPRRNHAPAFKAKVALAALKGDRALAEFAEQSDFHPNQSVFTLHDRRFAGHKALRHRETSGEDGDTYASLPNDSAYLVIRFTAAAQDSRGLSIGSRPEENTTANKNPDQHQA